MKTNFIRVLPLIMALLAPSLFASVLPDEPHIYVEGYAELGVYPDQLKFTVELTNTHLDASEAKKTVDQKTLTLFERVKQLGINKQDITATPLQIRPAYEYQNGKRANIGTKVTRHIHITLKDLSRYAQLNNVLVKANISELITTNVELTNPRAVKKKVLMQALKDAKVKAQQLADIQGKTIKDVYSISEFKTRTETPYTLVPSQEIDGPSVLEVRGVRSARSPSDVLDLGEMMVKATVYVVYTIE